MIRLFRQMIMQSPLSGISVCLALGCIFLVIQSFLFNNQIPSHIIGAQLMGFVVLGLSLHYYLKTREKVKKQKPIKLPKQ